MIDAPFPQSLPPRIMLAWEGGAGRGHMITLRTVARAMRGLAECDAALCDMTHAAEIAPDCALVFPGPLLPYDRAARAAADVPRTATWGEFMGDLGFRDAEFLRARVAWWLDTFAKRAIDLVVADYSPLAMMAARIRGIPAVAIGTGYGIAPAHLTQFPVFLPEYAQRIYDEGAMVAVVNDALGPLGLPPLRCLPEVYMRAGELVRTLDILDPYADARTVPLLPPVTDVGAMATGEGEEIFVYFSTTELDRPEVVETLASLRHPVRAFLPSAKPDVRSRLLSAGVMLERAPVPVDLIARRSRLVLNSGQHGILCLAMAAGLPQLCLPQHLEQFYHAYRAEQAGVARIANRADWTVPKLTTMIESLYADSAIAANARNLACELRPVLSVDSAVTIRGQLCALL